MKAIIVSNSIANNCPMVVDNFPVVDSFLIASIEAIDSSANSWVAGRFIVDIGASNSTVDNL